MYNVFNRSDQIRGTAFTYQRMPYARQQIKANVARAVEYYRTNYFRVASNHVLCKIILSLETEVDMGLPIEEYISQIDTTARNMQTMHGIVSPTMRSRPHNEGHFFGENSVEIYLADYGEVDVSDLESNWRDISPVTTVSHWRSDLLPVRPGLPFVSNESGLAVVRINVMALMVQYRMWRSSFESMGNEGVEQFVAHYPLTNMLESVTDVAVFNRHYNNLMGLPMGVPKTNVPFMTLNNERHLDVAIKIVRDKLRVTMMSPDAILLNTPVIYAESAYHLQVMGDHMATDQVTWALVAGKLRYVGYVLESLEQASYGDARGTKIRLTLRHVIGRLRGNRLLRNGVQRDVSDYLHEYIYDEILPRL